MKFLNSEIEYSIHTNVYWWITASTTSSVLKEMKKIEETIDNSESVFYFRLNSETNMIRKKFLYKVYISL